MRLSWLLLLAGCGQTSPLPEAGVDAGMETKPPLMPREIQCMAPAVGGSDAGDMKMCTAGQLCISFQGGVAMCQDLSAECKANPTCACKPKLPNATCNCSDDGMGRIIIDCH